MGGVSYWYWYWHMVLGGSGEWWAEKGERVGQAVGKSQLAESVEVGGLRHFASL